jgi:DEAD/DEAH box helicase domain-containing protein
VWWQLPQAVLDTDFASRQAALDGFLGAGYALHTSAIVAVMAEGRDLQRAVGSGDGGWSAQVDNLGRGQLRSEDGSLALADAFDRFVPTVYLYDNFPGGVGLSEPLFLRSEELLRMAMRSVARCACKAGCPACVGPVLAADEKREETPKMLAMRVLGLLDSPHE